MATHSSILVWRQRSSCLMDRGAWRATVHKAAKSQTHSSGLAGRQAQLVYNVMLVPAIQQSESAIRIHIAPLFWISFPLRSPQSLKYSPLCYVVDSQLSILHILSMVYGLSRRLSSKESTCQCRRLGFDPWVGKIPQKRKWQPTLACLLGKCHGQMNLGQATDHGLTKSWT